MKKFLYLIMLLLPLGFLSACSDDDDLPNVDVTVKFNNAVVDNGSVYVLQGGENLVVESVTGKGVGKNGGIANVQYNFSGLRPYPANPFAPYTQEFPTKDMKAGKYELAMVMNVLQEDKSVAISTVSFPVVVVETQEELPGGAQPGEASLTFSVSPNSGK